MRPLATRLLLLGGALLVLAALASTAAAAPAASGQAKGSLLYVQEGAGGSLERLGAGAYRLRLTGVSPRVTTFTDRPRRRAGRQSTAGFVQSWKANGFTADPPNAALVLDDAGAARDIALLTLSNPRFDRGRQTLTYRATPLRGREPALAAFARRADPLRSGRFAAASLFIDDGGGGFSTVTFDVQGEATTDTVQFLLTGGATWGLAQVAPLSLNGTVPLSGLEATRNAVSLSLLAGGGSLAFGLSIPIEPQGTEAPAVEVTNLSGTVTVTWATDTGLQTQALVAGDPVTLYGLIP